MCRRSVLDSWAEAVKRKPVLLCLGIALAVSLLLFYSLMGVMTGVYVFDGSPIGMYGYGRLIHRGDAWYFVYFENLHSALPVATKIEGEHFDIRPGTWAMTVTVNYGRPATIRAYPSLNPIDFYRFTFGDYRDLGR